MQRVLEEAEAKLQGFSQDQAKYETMLTDLLVQALAKLKQSETKVKSRKCDAELVKVRRSATPTAPSGAPHHDLFSVLPRDWSSTSHSVHRAGCAKSPHNRHFRSDKRFWTQHH